LNAAEKPEENKKHAGEVCDQEMQSNKKKTECCRISNHTNRQEDDEQTL
jgi:hypothetical protein